KILGRIVKLLPDHWEQAYGYQPLLLETFVDANRYKGTCYRAANWTKIGKTRGRGKRDRKHLHNLPTKDVFVYPLDQTFRHKLRGSADPQTRVH
ncbi:MAG: DUF4338 domain-containing protein, partial [Planctomycetota bacterium]|nr:DUF4338 domain-containing protein [Planctomycetota bacterium]